MRQKHLRAKRTLGNDPRHCTTRYKMYTNARSEEVERTWVRDKRSEPEDGVVVPNDFQINPECPEGERNKDVGETTALCRRNCPGPHRDGYDVSRPERSNTRRNG